MWREPWCRLSPLGEEPDKRNSPTFERPSGQGGKTIDILHLIDRIEALVASGTRVPFVNKVMVEEQQLLAILDQMRVSVPDDMRQAQHVLEERDRILAQARIEAQRIVATADEEAAARIESHDITRLAKQRSEELTAEAQRRADAIIAEAENGAVARRAEADQYVLDILRRIDVQLSNYLTSVRKGMEAMEKELQRP